LFVALALPQCTAAYAAWLVRSAPRTPGWLLWAVIAVGVAAAVASVSVAANGQSAFDTKRLYNCTTAVSG
jgi:hypothetical protein